MEPGMTAPLKAVDNDSDLAALMTRLSQDARAAAKVLALAPAEQKNRALEAMEQAIRANCASILEANAEDVAEARANGATSAFVDRLTLTEARVAAMADGLGVVRAITDPVGAVTERWQRPNGMTIERVRVPRGGKSLVARVEAEARVPVFAHLEGVNHVYVDHAAKLDMAKSIVLNAKMRRPGVCGAAETLLVERAAAPTHLKPLVEMLLDAGCEVRGDTAIQQVDSRVKPATDTDWDTEYEDAIIAAKVVDDVDGAIAHIAKHGSHHTEAIVTEDARAAEKFLNEVDSAIVLHNASTQFADGGEFGFGAEIGIATGKFHARGPVGAEQLTTFKYRVHGSGQTRP